MKGTKETKVLYFFHKNIHFNMKAQSKYFLNMIEVESHHLTAMATNKEHLCITFENP